ncbi:MAG: FlgD immunoglobulin-like domain containing protein [Bacteroidia bacterium]
MKTLTRNGNLHKRAFRLMLPALLLAALSVSAQITESVGTVTGTTSIASHEAANGFDEDGLTYSGTGDIRNTTASTGYTGASGLANVFLHTGKNFVISGLGTNACGGSLLTMSFGISKSTNAENGSHLVVEYSTDGGINWTGLSYTALPTGTGTSHWYLRTVSGLPATCNLKVRFSNTASGSSPDFRIDDISTSCGSAVESLCSASITANDTNVFCAGDSVRLTANSGDSYVWSNGATTQSILVQNSGTYSVTVENSCCFALSAGFYVLVHNDGNPNPVVGVSADTTICAGDSATLTARTFARGLFFSKYEEGSGFDKAVEIFNGTGSAVNLGDYEIRDFHNGACDNVAATYTIALPAVILNDGDVFTVANTSHSEIGGCFTPDLTTNNLQFNGDDAVTLFDVPNDQYTDIIGSICNDPGAAWTAPNFYSTQDRLLTRKPCVYEGIFINPNLPGTNGFPTLATEWLVDTIPTACGFGSHTMEASLYTWTPATVPATGATVLVSPSGTTSYVVNGEYCDGCPFSATVEVTVTDCGGRYAATQQISAVEVKTSVYPNPFTGNVTFNVNTPETGLVKIEIVNMLGETVAVLNNNSLPAGAYSFTWNGAADNGAILADGVYSCKVTTGSTVKSVMMLKSAN